MTFLGWLLTHKLLVLLISGCAAFGIATIVLAVDNSQLRSEIEELENNISSSDTQGTTSTTTTTTTTTTTPSTSTISTTTTEAPVDMSKYRLPTNIKPSLYDLYLYPDLSTGLFTGKVIVSITVSSESSSLVLHSNLLNITGVTIGSNSGNFSLDSSYELLTITKTDGGAFTASDDSVEVEFNGDMKNRIVGLYTSAYTNSSGVSTSLGEKYDHPVMIRNPLIFNQRN